MSNDIKPIDYDDLRRKIAEEIRAVLRERAVEKEGTSGMEKRTRKRAEFIHEGKYAAAVEIELHYTAESWSPTMSLDDARKLETVRLALQRGDVAEAAKYGRVFELTPVEAK